MGPRTDRRRILAPRALATGLLILGLLPAAPLAAAPLPHDVDRRVEPIVLTGADIPGWSTAAVDGTPAPYPSGAGGGAPIPGADTVRSAHNGHLTPAGPGGVDVDTIVAYRWTGGGWVEIPVQVDEVFPNFLANGRSDFAFYSGTDEELTYSWAPSASSTGEERWKRMWGECASEYATTPAQLTAAMTAGWLEPGAGEGGDGYGSGRLTGPDMGMIADAYLATPANGFNPARRDPVEGLDADDEVVFMASDAGPVAPVTAPNPAGTTSGPDARQQVAITDPLDPTSVRYVYLFQKPTGPSFDHTNGYVQYLMDDDANEFIGRESFEDHDPEKLGSSNRGYGANLPGSICTQRSGAGSTTDDRQPRDGLVVQTDAYRFTATGRWMIRGMQVAAPGQAPYAAGTPFGERDTTYGPDLIDRWKGRAFQQSPDSSVSLVGFEDEQVNWEHNASQLGYRVGPVRAIREVWGADSGTNVTKTETFYRDAIAYRYRVRVHPIPSDGLYTSWDYNRDAVSTYYNVLRPDGVPIDGVNDDTGQVDGVFGFPAYFDAPDPTFDAPSAVERWEQVAGRGSNGGLVYIAELTGETSLTNAAAVPYYRDDACLDDGTGDDPVPRPWPGETTDDSRVTTGTHSYQSYWRARTGNAALTYADLGCYNGRGNTPTDPGDSPVTGPGEPGGDGLPDHQRFGFQGAFASHGVHAFATQDSDNLFVGVPNETTELDFTQWQFAVPMSSPTNVGSRYGNTVVARLQTVVTPQVAVPAVTTTSPLRAGAASVDSTWHVGASAGQYSGEGAPVGVHGSDPFAHSTRRTPSYGIESREWVKAMVLEGSNGQRWAVVSNDLYIPQDLVNQRVGVLLEQFDALAALDPSLEPTGITVDNMTVSVSHSHTSPMYTTPAWGVWAFQDVFDVRHYEHMAQKMAQAVIAAAQELQPATVAAVEGPVKIGKKHSYGPELGDDRTPAGYPHGDFDPVMQVVRVDAVDGDPIANWVVYGLHPENLDGNDLLSSEYVNTLHTVLDREVGGVTVFSQNDTGTSEATESALTDPTSARAEHSQYEYAQVQRLARQLADAVMTLRDDVDRMEAGQPALLATNAVFDEVADSYFDDDAVVGVKDLRFAPPSARAFPTVSSCRAERTFDGNPGVPIAGLPDCEYPVNGPGQEFISNLPPELQPAVTYEALREAGVPIPDNVGAPSYTGLQETVAVHLQAVRIGDFGITVCPCEQFADQSRNIKTRLNETVGDLWYGFDWTANYTDNGAGSDYRTAGPVWFPGVVYDGATDASGDLLPGHGPLTLNDWCLPDDVDDPATWSCRNPKSPTNRVTVSDAAFRRMKAHIYNDATTWDRPENSAQAESEPADPSLIWGNYSHEELGVSTALGAAEPYDMVATVGMSNDYWGYIVSYREFQRGDYYRKALTGLGPHSSDFFATRLSRMAAELRGGPSVVLTAKDLAYQGETANQKARATAIGQHADTYLRAYETAMSPDAGDIGSVVVQPPTVERFDATTIRWVGGSNYVDSPNPRVERCVAACGTASAQWSAFGDGFGEVQVKAHFPVEEELALVRAGQFVWEWEAQFEAYDSEIDWTFADGVRRKQIPTGTYRFVIDGCARNVEPISDPGGRCPSYDDTGRVGPYQVVSQAFEVQPWTGITVEDLALASDGSTTFDLGPDFPYPIAYTSVEPDATRDHVDYPNSYDSVFRTRTTGGLAGEGAFIAARDDATCVSTGCTDLRTYPDKGGANGPPEVFCFHCTFEPWHDVAVIDTVAVTVRRANGATTTVPATFDPDTLTWSAPTALQPGDEAWVAQGGVLDTFGETNRESEHLLRAAVGGTNISGDEGSPLEASLSVTLPAGADDVTYHWNFGDGATESTDEPRVVHTWADDGTYTVTVDVRDIPGQPDVQESLTATIRNVAPTLQSLPDRTVNRRNGPVTLSASATDPAGDADPLAYTWNFGDGTSDTGRTVEHAYTCPGGYPCTYTVGVTVDDGDGGTDVETFALTVVDQALQVDAGDDVDLDEGDEVTFAATATPQNPGATLTYDWDFGDGTTEDDAGPTPTHRYLADGEHTVTVTVTEAGVGEDSDVLTATVANVAPTVTLTGPTSVPEGGTAEYSAAATDPGADDTVLTWRWYLGGVLQSAATGDTFSAPAGDGPSTLDVRAEAVDSDNAAGSDAVATPVSNVAPMVTMAGPASGDEGSRVTYTASATDAWAGDTFTYRWRVAGVLQSAAGSTLALTLPDGPGAVDVEVTAVDDDGAASVPASMRTDVHNVAPTVSVAGPDGVDEGDSATWQATVSDPGGDPSTLAWFVDGERVVGHTDSSFTLALPEGPRVVEVRVEATDHDGATGEGELHTVVDNVAPVVNLTGPTRADPGTTSTYEARFTDPGVEDTHTYAWYLDGVLVEDENGATLEVQHPDHRAAQVVRVLVTDDDGSAGSDDVTTQVQEAAQVLVTRVAGTGRVETAVAISQEAFTAARTVVLSRADLYPDALAGAPLAYAVQGPILLTDTASLSTATRRELVRLSTERVILLGGPNAISPQVERDLKAMGIHDITRLSGPSRFHTAAAIARELGADEAYVTRGGDADPSRGWPDALAVASLAAFQGRAILLVEADHVPEPTLAAVRQLGITSGTVIGGKGVISDQVLRDLEAEGVATGREAGSDRYATSRLLAEEAVRVGMDPAHTWMPTGRNWPDALTAGPSVAAAGGVLLLIEGQVPEHRQAREWIARHLDRLEHVRLLGGPNAVSAAVEADVRRAAER